MNHLANMLQENADSIRTLISRMVKHRTHVGRSKGFDSPEVFHLDKKIRKLNDDYQHITGTRLGEDADWSPEGIKRSIIRLRNKQEQLAKTKGHNSEEVAALDAQIYNLTQELRNLTGKYRGEAPDVDGEDEFDFDLDAGDDFDDSDDDIDSDFDDEDEDGSDDEDFDDEDEDDEDEDDEDEEEFDDEDEEEFDDEGDGTDVNARLDDLEDKLNSLLSKFAEVLASDVADDEDDEDFDDEDEDDEDFDDEDEDDDDLDFGDEDDIDYRESTHEDLMEDDPEDEYPESVVDQIISLGNFTRTMLEAGDSTTDRVLIEAINYLRNNPELESDNAAVALSALINGNLERYYRRLKDNYTTIRNQF